MSSGVSLWSQTLFFWAPFSGTWKNCEAPMETPGVWDSPGLCWDQRPGPDPGFGENQTQTCLETSSCLHQDRHVGHEEEGIPLEIICLSLTDCPRLWTCCLCLDCCNSPKVKKACLVIVRQKYICFLWMGAVWSVYSRLELCQTNSFVELFIVEADITLLQFSSDYYRIYKRPRLILFQLVQHFYPLL